MKRRERGRGKLEDRETEKDKRERKKEEEKTIEEREKKEEGRGKRKECQNDSKDDLLQDEYLSLFFIFPPLLFYFTIFTLFPLITHSWRSSN